MLFPLSYQFASVDDLNTFCARVVKSFGIYTRTSRLKSEVRLSLVRKQSAQDLLDSYGMYLTKYFGTKLDAVLYAIEWGRQTGRLSLNAEQLLDGFSGYQFAKFTVRLALTDATMQDVVDYLNGRGSVTLPIVWE